MTSRAHRLRPAARPHVDLDGPVFRAQPGVLVDEAWKVMAVVEEPDQPHGCKVHSKARDSKR